MLAQALISYQKSGNEWFFSIREQLKDEKSRKSAKNDNLLKIFSDIVPKYGSYCMSHTVWPLRLKELLINALRAST
jgi:hypothetical protein